ncbi:MAG: DUF4384 domain-containing protein, partial [Verrucomicrobia bacterium]|nr:DUF4384 domain-containing protein [Verrucomicrobiota bacterium]
MKPCAECGAALPADATDDLCPRCAIARRMREGIRRQLKDDGNKANDAASSPTAPCAAGVSSGLAPGAKIGSAGEFEILELIGEGGMGKVYRARQPLLDRMVAVKILSPKLADDPSYIVRFRREAAVAAKLSHPNIVTVHAAGESNGVHYFVMEYVEGESLQRRLEREGRLQPAEAIAICLQVAQALDYAWQAAQIVHRDVKPDNIFMARDPARRASPYSVKVGDLGLARALAADTPAVTEPGQTMGTPHYMSPEQVQGHKHIDFRTDIYSLGCTLYHMLTGRRPYSGDSNVEIMMKHVNEPTPDVLKILPDCPRPIVTLLAKMLAKKPSARHHSYSDLLSDLQACSAAIQNGAGVPPARFRSKPFVYVAAAAIAVVAVAIFLWSPWKGGEGASGKGQGKTQQNVGGASAPRPMPSEPSALNPQPSTIPPALPASDVLKIAYGAQPPTPPADAPRPQLRLELLAKRKGETTFTPLKDGDALASESDDYLVRAEALAPGHLYVFQVDSTGNKVWLYPRNETSSFSSGTNPLTAGQKVQVPSAEQGRALFLDRNTGVEHVYAVFAAARWPELETALAHKTGPTVAQTPTGKGQEARGKGEAFALSSSPFPLSPSRLPSVSAPFSLRTRGIGGLRPAE